MLLTIEESYSTQAILNQIVELVGNFDLDPDRVLDIIIEARIQHFNVDKYLELLKEFKKESITVIVSQKLARLLPVMLPEKLTFAGQI